MPFRLKNTGATYKWLVNKMFQKQIGKSMEIYVDNMLVKNKKLTIHVANLRQTFDILKKYKMRLNSKKCAFGVGFEKFIGFIMNKKGIVENPNKIKHVFDM